MSAPDGRKGNGRDGLPSSDSGSRPIDEALDKEAQIMADVIPFASRRRRFSPPSPTSDAGAQILFFTGVRYERVAEPPQRKASARLGRSSAAPKGAGRRKARQPA